MEEQLTNLYKEFNYPSAGKFRDILKSMKIKATTKEINAIVNQNNVAQVHKQIFADKEKMYSIAAIEPLEIVQIDLLDYQKFATTNSNYKFILIAIDIFSRYAFACCLKNKTPAEVLRGFKTFHIKPTSIHHDSGNEYKGVFLKWLHDNNIADFTSEIGNHNALAIVDRFSKTIKSIISRYMTAANSTKYFNKLDEFIKAYNSTPNAGIDNIPPIKPMTDFDAYNSVKQLNLARIEFNKQLTKELQKSVSVGDKVRVKLSKKVFKKGYELTYSPEIYTVMEIVGGYVLLDDGV